MLSSLPNILTLSRILAVPFLVLLLWDSGWVGHLAAFVLFGVAAATDYLDGYLARSQGTVSKLGVFLDPIADKIMVAATIVMLVHTGTIHGWAVIPALVILLREITVSGLREYLAALRVSVPVTQVAKYKTTLQLVSLGFLIAGPAGEKVLPYTQIIGLTLLWAAALLTLYSGWDYMKAGMKYVED